MTQMLWMEYKWGLWENKVDGTQVYYLDKGQYYILAKYE